MATLIFVNGVYTIYTQSWTFWGLTGPSTTTTIEYGANYTISLNHSRGDVETYVRANTDANGFCDLRPLQA